MMNPIFMLVSIIIYIGILLLLSYLVMLIFNDVVFTRFPDSNVKPLTIWEGMAILVLCSILFGSSRIDISGMSGANVGKVPSTTA